MPRYDGSRGLRVITAQLVTTIIPVYNRGAMLVEAVDSVLAQTHRPIEIVIVDDGSTDDTGAVANGLASRHAEIRVIRQANGGVGAARETGRLAARGEFIQHLDSDDLLYPRKFELQVAGLLADPSAGASYGWTRMRHLDGSLDPKPWKRTGEVIAAMFPAFLESRWWETSTPLFRADVIRQAGPWTTLQTEEDWEYDCRVASLGTRLHYCPEWIAEKREHGVDQLSRPTPERLQSVFRDRSEAHRLIFGHSVRAGVSADVPEMRHFARELFLLARQCGAIGLPRESEMLFRLAREASGPESKRLQFRLYGALARALGWPAAGRIAGLMDRLR